jgi:hypothetical protein
VTWEDEFFIQKHPQLINIEGNLFEGEGHVKPLTITLIHYHYINYSYVGLLLFLSSPLCLLYIHQCNVPIFGFTYVTDWDAYQSSQLRVIVRSGGIEGFIGPDLPYLSYFIIRIHSAQLVFGFVAFRRFP